MQQPGGRKPEILVIDDDQSVRFMMQTKLFQAGFHVTLAASGTHAIQILSSNKIFDVILCDLKMPLKSGTDVIRYLRERKIETPLILVTGSPERDPIISAAKMGVMDVLVKPVRQQDLMRLIAEKLALKDANANKTA